MRWFGSGCLFLFVSLDRIQILHHLCKYKWMLKLNHADRLQRCAAALRCYFGLLVTADTYTVLFFQWRATLPPPCCFPSQSCSSNCLTLPAVLLFQRPAVFHHNAFHLLLCCFSRQAACFFNSSAHHRHLPSSLATLSSHNWQSSFFRRLCATSIEPRILCLSNIHILLTLSAIFRLSLPNLVVDFVPFVGVGGLNEDPHFLIYYTKNN